MSKPNDATVSLKIMINKQKTKVLFAEADSDFIDILFSFLTLPLGKIAKLLEDHQAPPVGSLSNLYASVANLSDKFFVNEAAKLMLLNPRSSFQDVCPNLKLDVADTQPVQYFICNNCKGKNRAKNICMYYGSGSCDSCGDPLLREMNINGTKEGDGVGFTLNTASFFICDDLRVETSATGFLQPLKNFNIADTNGTELRDVTFGIDEFIGLLKRCLLSETPFTDLILNKSHKPSSLAKPSSPKIALKTEKTEDGGSSKYIILKITVQKSTNKLLFAHAQADFVEVLFSFLTIPLGEVESLLDSNTCSTNFDNLYRSLVAIDSNYFRVPDLKSMLMNPKLAPGYSSRKQFLPLNEKTAPTLYTYDGVIYYEDDNEEYYPVPYLKSPKGLDNYVKEPTTYMVTDDLIVTPFGLTSGLSFLDRLNIPLSDVDELELHIGLEEVLGILRASLTSTFALSIGLINHMEIAKT